MISRSQPTAPASSHPSSPRSTPSSPYPSAETGIRAFRSRSARAYTSPRRIRAHFSFVRASLSLEPHRLSSYPLRYSFLASPSSHLLTIRLLRSLVVRALRSPRFPHAETTFTIIRSFPRLPRSRLLVRASPSYVLLPQACRVRFRASCCRSSVTSRSLSGPELAIMISRSCLTLFPFKLATHTLCPHSFVPHLLRHTICLLLRSSPLPPEFSLPQFVGI